MPTQSLQSTAKLIVKKEKPVRLLSLLLGAEGGTCQYERMRIFVATLRLAIVSVATTLQALRLPGFKRKTPFFVRANSPPSRRSNKNASLLDLHFFGAEGGT